MASTEADKRPRSREKVFVVRCPDGQELSIRKARLRWTDSFRCKCGTVLSLDDVLEQLHDQGHDVHDLARGRGNFRERVQGLPMPQGGSFVAGETLQRSDDAGRSGSRIWRFKPVERARPFEKGFSKVR